MRRTARLLLPLALIAGAGLFLFAGPRLLPKAPALRTEAEREEMGDPDADSPEQRFQWLLRRQMDENGNVLAGGRARAIAQKEALIAAQRNPRLTGETWNELGPTNVSGRARCLAIHPTNTSTMFLGTAGGGIWRTDDAGATWAPISEKFASLAIGTIVFDPQNPNTMYAGTGEGYFNSDAIQGAGIYKSTDGGKSWSRLSSTTGFTNVNRIAVCPTNSNLILCTTTYGGVRRSTDGGATWTTTKSVQLGHQVMFAPGSSTKAFATLEDYNFSTGQWFQYVAVSNDGGATWTASNGLSNVVITNSIGRIEVGVSASNPLIVYASSADNGGVLYKSLDGGANFARVSVTGTTGASWYCNGVWVDPTNPNNVVVTGLYSYRSIDGGVTLTQISNGYIQTTQPHPDDHFVTATPDFDGLTKTAGYICTDGGLYRATNLLTASLSGGWQRLDTNIRTTQYYSIAGDAGNGSVLGGLQDNGTQLFTYPNGTSGYPFGGDGGFVAIDPTSPSTIYGEYINLEIWRNGRYIYSGISDAGTGNANFIAPFIMDPNDHNTLFAGGVRLWKSTNATASTPTWSIVRNAGNNPISAIAVAKGNSNLIWVGQNNGVVAKTTDGGANWTTISGIPARYVGRILIDQDDPNTVYIGVGGYSSGNLLKTTNGGTTWTTITGSGATGLPQAPVYAIARAPGAPNTLYVGTEVGLFSTSDGGATWSVPGDLAANVSVEDLQYMNGSRTLLAGTHGRGVWALPQTVVGTVTLQDYTGDVTVPTITVDVRDGSGTSVKTYTTHLSAGGALSINTDLAPGTYTFAIKADHWLRKNVTGVTVRQSGALGLSVSLINGDVNGDNQITATDNSILSTAYRSKSTSSNWDPRADLNGDGQVSATDASILSRNFRTRGDN